MKMKYLTMKLKVTCTSKTLQKWKNIVTKESENEIVYLEKEIVQKLLVNKNVKKWRDTVGLWIHESIPKCTHRIEMKIGQFIS
jgi:hypothetical protein